MEIWRKGQIVDRLQTHDEMENGAKEKENMHPTLTSDANETNRIEMAVARIVYVYANWFILIPFENTQ